jgi:hypothetical protein
MNVHYNKSDLKVELENDVNRVTCKSSGQLLGMIFRIREDDWASKPTPIEAYYFNIKPSGCLMQSKYYWVSDFTSAHSCLAHVKREMLDVLNTQKPSSHRAILIHWDAAS